MKLKPSVDPVLVLIAAMCVLLPGLAMLQFSWIGDVEKADEARMRALLQRSSDHLGEEFNGEIARFYRAVLVPAAPLPAPRSAPAEGRGAEARDAQPADDPCQRFVRWHSAAAQPRLIRAIYILGEGDHLESCNLDTGGRVPAVWPEDLKATAKLWSSAMNHGQTAVNFKDYIPMLPAPWRPFRSAGPRPGGPHEGSGRWRGFGFPPGVPGIRLPEIEPRDARERGFGEGLRPGRPFPGFGAGDRAGLVLAVPDLAWVQAQWLPELVSKHFGNPSSTEAVVRVELSVPHTKVYESRTMDAGSGRRGGRLVARSGFSPAGCRG